MRLQNQVMSPSRQVQALHQDKTAHSTVTRDPNQYRNDQSKQYNVSKQNNGKTKILLAKSTHSDNRGVGINNSNRSQNSRSFANQLQTTWERDDYILHQDHKEEYNHDCGGCWKYPSYFRETSLRGKMPIM